jgi:undecaprenyl-diphosphatase
MHPVTAASLRPIGRFTARSIVGLAAIVVAGAVVGGLLGLARGWPPLGHADQAVAQALNHAFAPRPMGFTGLTAIAALGGNAVIWWLVTVTAGGMLIRRQPRVAAFLVVTGLGALALAPLIKLFAGWLGRRLPETVASAPGHSFPSGHALNATVFYGAVFLVFFPVIPRRFRGLVSGVAVALVAAVGVSRGALGVPHISDVVVGWLVGLAWLGVTTYAFRQWRVEAGRPWRPRSPAYAAGARRCFWPSRCSGSSACSSRSPLWSAGPGRT